MMEPLRHASEPDVSPMPIHVAIIMDGNGRWAKKRSLPRTAGHRKGAETIRTVVETATEMGIPYLTLFGFSSENWKRPKSEVADLMGLLRIYLEREVEDLSRNGVRLRVIGDHRRLAPDIVDLIRKAEQKTQGNSRITLVVALSYGSRAEILAAARALAEDAAAGRIDPKDVDEEMFSSRLLTADIPDPDLLIRTSGEQRLSNFLLWQLSYAELLFVDTLWPDFSRECFVDAVNVFRNRDRRYGIASV